MDILEVISEQKHTLQKQLSKEELTYGEIIYNNGQCQMLSQSAVCFDLMIEDTSANNWTDCSLHIDEAMILPKVNGKRSIDWDKHSYACLLQIENELTLLGETKRNIEHKKYTREGMINRVLKERYQKAAQAEYRIEWADNIYGNHILTNEQGIKYTVFLRDFENETGYSNSMDARLNKLGSTKHIMFAFNALKENKKLYKSLDKTYPFIEVFCDSLNEYKITWHYPHIMPIEEQLLLSRYFKNSNVFDDTNIKGLLNFIEESKACPNIHIRPEVIEKIAQAFEDKLLQDLSVSTIPDFSKINATLYPYQKEGIMFALFRKGAIIADEMGLGKTIQAIGAAVLKKDIFGFTKTLIVCPASLKSQWKKEIEKFTTEPALIVNGTPEERALHYKDPKYFFFIVNYETILRDQVAINAAGMDFLILDEAQRAKNYETKTAASIKRIDVKHKLVITGTPIENRLIDIFSIIGILDPYFLGPLWEFSYQHCLFDTEKPNKINGYYNLKKLNKKLENILIRREKRNVLNQLPSVRQIDIPVNLSPLQAEYHASYANGLAHIIRKKFLTAYDIQRMQLLLTNMRMVCDSTYLIDNKTNESPKLEELRYILFEQLDIKNKPAKIIIFSEWITVHKLIGRLLRENNVGFVELNGKVPVKLRGELIHKFETSAQHKVFLSTEAGGSGLNLQVADTLINFELPWNPAKKNQRIGRIDRIGQKSTNLTIYNLITRNSIEMRIASGLLVKQSLSDGVLGNNTDTDYVDFSSKGRSQFIDQLEALINESEIWEQESEAIIETSQSVNSVELLKEDFTNEINFAEEPTEQDYKPQENKPATSFNQNTEELEQVMNNGLQFLSGLLKMTTGKDMPMQDQKVKVNKETGEITLTFKLPS